MFAKRLPAADLLRREQPATTPSSARRPAARTSSSTCPRAAASSVDRRTPTTARPASPVGSLFNKLLYAVKFGEPNIVLSEPGQREPQDPLRPRAPRAGAEGRAVADRRRDPYPAVDGPGSGRRDLRALHDGDEEAARHHQHPAGDASRRRRPARRRRSPTASRRCCARATRSSRAIPTTSWCARWRRWPASARKRRRR